MRRVFDGGVGATRGGMLERSIDMFVFLDSREVGRDDCGELSVDILKVWMGFYGEIREPSLLREEFSW
jgi:hypothetical protein